MAYQLVLVLAPAGAGLLAAVPGVNATEGLTEVKGAPIGAAVVGMEGAATRAALAITGAAEATAGGPVRVPGMAKVGAPVATARGVVAKGWVVTGPGGASDSGYWRSSCRGAGGGRDPRPSSFPGGKWQILVSILSPKFSFLANYDGWIEDSVTGNPMLIICE
jgi:hypothetical protein